MRLRRGFGFDSAHQSSCGGCPLKRAIKGATQPAVLLMMRYWPPPMLTGALFQKPFDRLLTKHAACSALIARTCARGTKIPSLQLAQNLFLKCSLPGTKSGVHSTSPSSAPQQVVATSPSSSKGLGEHGRASDLAGSNIVAGGE